MIIYIIYSGFIRCSRRWCTHQCRWCRRAGCERRTVLDLESDPGFVFPFLWSLSSRSSICIANYNYLAYIHTLWYIYCSFLRSDIEAKRSGAFRHLTSNSSRIRRRMGNGRVWMSVSRFPLPTLLCAGTATYISFHTFISIINYKYN